MEAVYSTAEQITWSQIYRMATRSHTQIILTLLIYEYSHDEQDVNPFPFTYVKRILAKEGKDFTERVKMLKQHKV